MSKLPKKAKEIPGFLKYYATPDGRIWSGKTCRFLTPTPAKYDKYLRVTLVVNSKRYCQLVHRLVLLAFVGPPPGKTETRHLNGNGADNRLSNLCWGTKQQNEDDKTKHGSRNAPRGSVCKLSKLSEEEVKKIRALIASGNTNVDIGRQFEVKPNTISCIKHGVSWAWL